MTNRIIILPLLVLAISLFSPHLTSAATPFIRGDVNLDSNHDLADPIFILSYLFGDGPTPRCLDAADVNDDGGIDLSDPIMILSHLFANLPSLPAPFPSFGLDLTNDRLSCNNSGFGDAPFWPENNARLTGPFVTFFWQLDKGDTALALDIGDQGPGSYNILRTTLKQDNGYFINPASQPIPQDGRTIYVRFWYRPANSNCCLRCLPPCPYADFQYQSRYLIGLKYLNVHDLWNTIQGTDMVMRPTPPLDAQQIFKWTNTGLHSVQIQVGSTLGGNDIDESPVWYNNGASVNTWSGYRAKCQAERRYIRLLYRERPEDPPVFNDYMLWQPLKGMIRPNRPPSIIDQSTVTWGLDIPTAAADSWVLALVDLENGKDLSHHQFSVNSPGLYDITMQDVPTDGRLIRADLIYGHPQLDNNQKWQLAHSEIYQTMSRQYSDLIATSLHLKRTANVQTDFPPGEVVHEIPRGAQLFFDAFVIINNARAPGGNISFDSYEDIIGKLTVFDADTLAVLHSETVQAYDIDDADPAGHAYYQFTDSYIQEVPPFGSISIDQYSFEDVGWLTGGLSSVTYNAVDYPGFSYDGDDYELDAMLPDSLTRSGISAGFQNFYLDFSEGHLRKFNQDYNSHEMPCQCYIVHFDDDLSTTPVYDVLTFTFKVDTDMWHVGRRLGVRFEVDPDNAIPEYFAMDWNNVLQTTRDTDIMELVTPDDYLESLIGPEAMEVVHRCNEWAMHYPEAYRVTVKKPGRISSDEYDMFYNAPNDYVEGKADKVYLAEYWGPHGTGKYQEDGSWVDAARDRLGRRPRADEIEHVFMFSAGNSGWQYGPSNVTGHLDTDRHGYDFGGGEDPLDVNSLEVDMFGGSWAGQIIRQESQHLARGHYGSANSFMGLLFHPRYKWNYDHKGKIREMYLDWLRHRTDDFYRVKNIVLGGYSRGGVLVLSLAKEVRDFINNDPAYNPHPSVDEVRIIILAQDPAGSMDGDGINLEDTNFQIGGMRFGNGNCHNFFEAYGLTGLSDPQTGHYVKLYARINVGESKAMDSVFHWRDCTGSEFVDPDRLEYIAGEHGWFEQIMVGYGHEDMGVTDSWVLVGDMLGFMARKLDWDNAGSFYYGSLPDHCEDCSDGEDNDGDGRADCADIDCSTHEDCD